MATALVLGLLPVSGETQESEGRLAELTFSEQFVWENGDGSLRSDLGFAFSSETANQTLQYSFGAALDKTLDDSEIRGDLVDPRAAFLYELESRNTLLRFDASYLRDDISTLAALDILGQTALVLDEGDREDIRLGVLYEFGREAPFGGFFSLDYVSLDYVDTISPTLLDSEQTTANLQFRFAIDPSITARVDFRNSELDRNGGVDVDRNTVSAGVVLNVRETTRVEFDLGYTEVTQSGTVPRSTEDGLIYSLALFQEMPNGELRGSLFSDIDENGRRTTARVDRDLLLPRGSLSFGLGASVDDDTDDLQPLYSVRYSQELPRGGFSADFSQAFSSTSAGDETLDSRLALTYQQALTRVSNFDLRISFRDTEVLEGATLDSQQLNFSVSYAHELNQDWSAVAGYTHVRSEEDGGNREIDDEVFIGLRTSIQWRP